MKRRLPGTTLRLLSITDFGHLTAIKVATSTKKIKRDFRALGQQVKGSEEQVAFFSILSVARRKEQRDPAGLQMVSPAEFGGFWLWMSLCDIRPAGIREIQLCQKETRSFAQELTERGH